MDTFANLGNRNPGNYLAHWDGGRSVRLVLEGSHIGLATTTYSYSLSPHDREQAARRIAALWNLALAKGWNTEEIERAAEAKA